MSVVFDQMAPSYDEVFSSSPIGKMQRDRVWKYMDEVITSDNPRKVLELNCGTGEDAIYLAAKGCSVLATDYSPAMLEATTSKLAATEFEGRVRVSELDITELSSFHADEKFDIVFSNFGGLNCISREELKTLADAAAEKLNPRGRFIAVVMPKFCMWEFLYFVGRLQFRKGLRRLTASPVPFEFNGSHISISYHNPKPLFSAFSQNFQLKSKAAVGFFIPPSYLNSFFRKKRRWLRSLSKLENFFGRLSYGASAADHYLIDMELKPRRATP